MGFFVGGPMPDDWSNSEDGEPAFRFDDGALHIFDGEHRMHIVGWPEPRAQEVRARWRDWRVFTPTFRLVAPYRAVRKQVSRQVKKDAALGQMGFDLGEAGASEPKPKPLSPAQRRKRAFDGFRFSLPKEVARALEKFRSYQWAPLLMMRHDPAAIELMNSNPVLGCALAHTMNADVGLFASLQVGTMRQRDILGLIKLPETAGVVKWMGKIPPESVTVESLRWARRLFSGDDDAMVKKWLGHLPSLNMGVLRLLSDENLRAAATTNLLLEIAESKRENYEARTAARLAQMLELRRQIGEGDDNADGRRGLRVDSMAALDTLLHETEERWQEAQRRRAEQQRVGEAPVRAGFPVPPVPGMEGCIEPLRDVHALMIEGAEQENCVASYADRVRRGSTYIYRVLHPQRCTLSLSRGADGRWRVGELEFSDNRPADGSTRDFVDAWLSRYRISA